MLLADKKLLPQSIKTGLIEIYILCLGGVQLKGIRKTFDIIYNL